MEEEAEPGERPAGKASGARLYLVFVLCYLAAVVAIFYANPYFLQSLRYLVFDSYQRLTAAESHASPAVRIVDIDEASLNRIGQWPWPRSTMAQLTGALTAAGARAIAYDVMFPEPDRTSPEQVLRGQPEERARALAGVIASWQPYDAQFAEAIGKGPVVLAATLSDSGPPQTFPAKAGIVLLGDPPQRFLARYGTVAENLPALTQAASGVGAINWIPDRDQVVRRVPLFFRQRDNIAPALAMEALRVAERQSTYMIRSSNASGQSAIGRASGVNLVRVGRYAIPTDADSGLWIRFRRSDPGAYIPAWRVLEGRLGPQDVHGAIVLVGTSAAGLLDLRATPLDPAIPGVEVHQQLLEQIMSGHYLTRPDYAPALELLLAALGIIVFAVLAPRLSATPTAGLGVGLIGFVFALGLWSYLGAGLLIDPLYPSLAIFIFAVASTFYLYRQTERQRSEIRRAFGQYVSPAVIHQLIANPDRLTLGGEVRELSLLFCDVRNFTSISERMNAAELTSFINSLLTPLTDIVLEQRGTIDKYMGDAIMAFWNAPIDDPDHAAHACAAAKAIIFKMKDLNTIWRAQAEAAGRPYAEVMIGVGINSGDCCVGNLGSQRRFDYSAIGDNVNVTARFEGLTKIYDLPVIVGEDTIRHLDDMEFMEVDLVRVKGRSAPLRIFTIVSALTLETKSGAAFAGAHMAFLKAMRAKRWDDAAARLEQARALGGASMHTLYALFDRRLAYLKDHAPADWDGVYNVETKD